MTINPVYRREMTVSSRSIRLPLILGAFNMVLAIFAIFMMAIIVDSAKVNAQIDYGTFLEIFRYVAAIEFALILLIMPALTAGQISGERERKTLDLMLTTKITPAGIVFGKLEVALSTVMLLIVSSLPVIALVFAYGGVTIANIGLLFISYIVAAFLMAAIGIWASSLCTRSTIATVLSYIGSFVFLVGTAIGAALSYNFNGSTGNWFNVMLANPAATFYAAIFGITGNRGAIEELAGVTGGNLGCMSQVQWFLLGEAIQIAIGFILVVFAIHHVDPKNKKSIRKT